ASQLARQHPGLLPVVYLSAIFEKKRNLYHFEKVLLRFFSKVSMSTPDKYPELFKRLDTELFSETSEEAMTNTLDYLNFKRWIEKKVGVIFRH
ncbi:hypothetical protein IH879_22385, partial [candidate division KSB1 bacterium]|nr:hypothetical protein [candidate division KSB1 bacterium]